MKVQKQLPSRREEYEVKIEDVGKEGDGIPV